MKIKYVTESQYIKLHILYSFVYHYLCLYTIYTVSLSYTHTYNIDWHNKVVFINKIMTK